MKKDEEVFILTEQECMHSAMHDFGFEVNIHVAKAIMDRFLELMIMNGYITKEVKEK